MKRMVVMFAVAACGSSHGAMNSGVDGGADAGSGSGPGSGEAGSDSLPCTPHAFACGSNDDVEVCNNAGTAWLYDHSCAIGCFDGVCTDPTCTPGGTQCAGNSVQTCGSDGATWTTIEACSTFCEAGQCALDGLVVDGSGASYGGTIVVAGDVVIGSGATLSVPSGDLTIIADNITVEPGGTIAVAPTSQTTGNSPCAAPYTPPGGPGESTIVGGVGITGGDGGGTLRLFAANNLSMSGVLSAPGGSYGGGGGEIALAADVISVAGTIQTYGGKCGTDVLDEYGDAGGGVIKLMYGSSITTAGDMLAAGIDGYPVQGVTPPLTVTSPTLPNQGLLYNDDGWDSLEITYQRPFPTVRGYMHAVDQIQYSSVSVSSNTFTTDESFQVSASELKPGSNYIHVISLDQNGYTGPETTFSVAMNAAPPSVASSTHPNPTTWYASTTPIFGWSVPAAMLASFTRYHYVFDRYADTVPTTADTALPLSQTQIFFTGVANGIWAMHVVAEDTIGHVTKLAGTAVVRIGPDPGTGTLLATVVDQSGNPISGASVRVNRGFFSGTTTVASSGTSGYTNVSVPAGTWEISVVYPGYHVAPQTVTVTAGENTSAAFTLIQD